MNQRMKDTVDTLFIDSDRDRIDIERADLYLLGNQILAATEVCICAAVLLDDGRIIRGHRHDDCIHTALKWKKAGQDVGERALAENQGFVTSRGRFVNRVEGARLQTLAGAISAFTGEPFVGTVLFSEDLY